MPLTKKPNFNDPFLAVALEAAAAAKKVILTYFDETPEVAIKADNSPVTIADKETEKIIKKIISHKFPEHGFIGEEGGASSSQAEYTWIIDPIDGTKAFIRGLPQFATLIALQKNGETIMGLSYMPIFDELLYAVKGKGAFLNHQKTHVSQVKSLSEAYVSVGTIKRFKELGKLENFIELDYKTRLFRALGDSYHFHLLAAGKVDIIMEAKGKIWDWAAFDLIVREAGGIVTQINGQNFGNNAKSILATNTYLHSQVVEYFTNKT